jgi:hypothetical protein
MALIVKQYKALDPFENYKGQALFERTIKDRHSLKNTTTWTGTLKNYLIYNRKKPSVSENS